MSSIDERVVRMKFDNAAFERGIASTMRSLQAFNKSLQLQGATKGLIDVNAAAQKVNLKNVESGVQSLADKFKAMSVVATTALVTVAHQAVAAGGRLVKSLTIEPLLSGFREYETNLNSIQTVLANTTKEGTKLKNVTAALDELNRYSDKTIYNFSEMAKNIGTFTAAGVDLKTSTAAIKGIANLAAISGSNSQQASAAMYQLSQALSEGKVSLESWNSVVNAGMGGQVFQDSLVETARVHGIAVDKMIKDAGSFRLSLQEGWLTGEVLTETLSKFTGDLNAAQLKTMGYNDDQIKGILKMAKTAQDAATKVKTFTQLMSTLQEAAGSGWARTWQLIFGDFDEAKSLFTNVNDVLGGFITKSAEARNKVLGDWKELGGRKVIIEAISNAFKALVSVVTPIGKAFRQIFPAATGKQLYDLSVSIRNFTAGLKISGKTAENLRRTFAGVFAILDIGFMVVKEIVKTFFTLIGVATKGSGGFLEFTGSIGDWLVKVRDAIKQGEGLTNLFKGIGAILSVPIKLIQKFAGFLASLFKDVDGSGASKAIGDVSKKLEPLGRLGTIISAAWGKVLTILGNVFTFFDKVGNKAAEFFGGFGTSISDAFKDLDFSDVLAGLNTGLFATIVLMIKKLIGGGGVGGILDNIGDSFENLTGALGAMQNTLRAATLLQIAAAVGILAISMNTLSKIDAAGLARASAAITVMFTQLLGSMLIFEKFSGFVGFAKMPFVAASMILLGAAINVLALAVKQLAGLSWEDLAKGLTGTTVLLASLIGVAKLMPNPAGMVTTAAALVILASSIKILASAVNDLSGLSWEEMAKGLIGVGAILGGLTLFTKFAAVGKGGLASGAGIILLAAGIKILASAMKDLSGLSWEEIGRGLAALAGGLTLITAALILIPPTAPLGAASVLIVAMSLGKVGESLQQLGSMSWGTIGKGLTALLGALTIITAALTIIPPTAPLGAASILIVALSLKKVGDALAQMAAMGWEEIGKAMVALAGSLLIIGVAVTAMSGSITGAAAILVVSAALAILAPVLTTLGGMSWGEIGKGLLVIAAAFIIFGVAGAVLTPVVPTLLGLGAAILLLGAGAALAGVGILALSAGLAALAVTGAAGTAVLLAMASGMIALIPQIVEAIGKGLILFAEVIAKSGPAITKALVVVLNSLITAIAVNTPKIANQIYKMLLKLIQVMNQYAGPLADAGAKLIVNILNGVARNIGKIVTAAVNLIVAFINAIAAQQARVINAGVKLIISFVNGLANAIRSNSGALRAAGVNLAMAIIDGMTGGLASGVGRIAAKAREVASAALNAAKGVLGIASPSKEFEKLGNYVNDGFRKGLDGNSGQITTAFKSLQQKLADVMRSSAKDVDQLEDKLKRLTHARKKDKEEIRETRAELAQARKEYKATSAAYSELNKRIKAENTRLGNLANKQDQVAAKLKSANEKLADAIKTRDDYNKSIKDQFDNLPETSGETTLASYVQNLRKQIEDTKKFSTALQKLRDLGLSDALYKELLSKGTSALPFVEQLLASGKGGVDEVNNLGKDLEKVAGDLADKASSALYQAAVDSAAGLVKGLENQMKAIEKIMDKIAESMVKSIKKKLGIKSPSKEFAEIGQYSVEGLAKGLDANASIAEKSAQNVGDKAIVSLRNSLANVSKMVISEMDMQPTIRPVLDLTQVKKTAGELGGIFPTSPISVDGSYNKARLVSAQVRNNQEATDEDPTDPTQPRGGVSFTQNNYSPKALSSADIYRQTKNQLSVAKGALANS